MTREVTGTKESSVASYCVSSHCCLSARSFVSSLHFVTIQSKWYQEKSDSSDGRYCLLMQSCLKQYNGIMDNNNKYDDPYH